MDAREYFEQGQNAFISGKHEESITMFGKALEAGFDPVKTLLSRGAAFLNIGELDKALQDFDQLLEQDPDNERAYYYRGIISLNKGNFQQAADDLSDAISRNPQRGASFLARGIARAELDLDDEAADDFKQAVAFSQVEVEQFLTTFSSHRTTFQRSMALLEGERGPVTMVLDESEIEKLKNWMDVAEPV